DGIRGFHVTGVQTCALPISRGGVFALEHAEPALPTGKRVAVALGDAACKARDSEERTETYTVVGIKTGEKSHEEKHTFRVCKARSEERRVGKECRARGATKH